MADIWWSAAADSRHIGRLIADLDRPEFEKRQTAHAELLDLAGLAEPALREALQNPPSAEVRRHLEELLEQGKVQRFLLAGDRRLRTWRAPHGGVGGVQHRRIAGSPWAPVPGGGVGPGDGRSEVGAGEMLRRR